MLGNVLGNVIGNVAGNSLSGAVGVTAPTYSSINTAWGMFEGGSSRIVTFSGGVPTSVTVDGNAATITASDATTVTFTTPAADTPDVGAVDIVLTNAAGSSTGSGVFTYTSPEYVGSVMGASYIVRDANRGITLNGGDVSGWDDQGNLATQSDLTQGTAGKQPLFSASGGPNSRPIVDFTLANTDNLAKLSVGGFSAGIGLWHITVCRPDTLPAATSLISIAGPSSVGSSVTVISVTNSGGVTKARAVRRNAADSASASAVGSTTLSLGSWYLVDGSYVSPNLVLYLNGTSDGTAASDSTVGNAAAYARLGGFYDDTSLFDGGIALDVIIGANITTTGALWMERYIEERFGLTIATRTI